MGVITRIDASSHTVGGSARVGDDATDMAVDHTGVWVSDRDGSLYHVDGSTMEPRRLSLAAEVIGVALDDADGSLWVYLGEAIEPTP